MKVSGLVTAGDIISQLKAKNISRNIFIPDNMLRKGDPIFLDNLTIEDIEKELDVRVIVCKQDGSDLVENMLKYCR